MIILFGKPDEVTRNVSSLCRKYKGEIGINNKNFLVPSNDSTPEKNPSVTREANGELPSRLTFLAHSGDGLFGPYDAKKFSTVLIDQLKKAAALEPEIKNSITQIDLVGCETGMVVKKGGLSIADEVASEVLKLQKEGFNKIEVKAFTNLSNPKPFPTEVLYLHLTSANTLKTLSMPYKEFGELYEKQLESGKEASQALEKTEIQLAELQDIEQELKSALKTIENKLLQWKEKELKHTRNLNSQSFSSHEKERRLKLLENAKKKVDFYEQLQKEKINNLSKNKEEQMKCEQTHAKQLKTREEIGAEFTKFMDKIKDDITFKDLGSDIRKALDADPKCNFTKRVLMNQKKEAKLKALAPSASLTQTTSTQTKSNYTPSFFKPATEREQKAPTSTVAPISLSNKK